MHVRELVGYATKMMQSALVHEEKSHRALLCPPLLLPSRPVDGQMYMKHVPCVSGNRGGGGGEGWIYFLRRTYTINLPALDVTRARER